MPDAPETRAMTELQVPRIDIGVAEDPVHA